MVFGRASSRVDFASHRPVPSPGCISHVGERGRGGSCECSCFKRLFGIVFSVLLVEVMLISLEHHLYNSKYIIIKYKEFKFKNLN